MVGAIVFFVGFLCFASCIYSLYKLFDTFWFSLPISLFFAWMICNIYLVLLTTLSKNGLPHITSKGGSSISLIVRLLFLIIIGLIVAKPFEVKLFSSQLDKNLEIFKKELINSTEFSLIHKYDQEIIHLRKELFNSSAVYSSQSIHEKINETEEKKEQELKKIDELLNNSSFFLQRLKFLYAYYPQSWGITLIVIFIFLLPAGIKYYISETTSYYARKTSIEKNMILEDYADFKQNYADLFFRETGKSISFDEQFEDPPFNTVHKSDKRNFETEKDFLNIIYGGKD